MIVMVLEKVSDALRGELTRWLLEAKTGVYVGNVNAMVRDRLWDKCSKRKGSGSIFQAWNTNNEQGFAMRYAGKTPREVVDWEGVQLIREAGGYLNETQQKRMEEG